MSFFIRHKIITALLILIVALGAWVYSWRIGPHHNYELDMLLPAAEAAVEPPGQLEVGVAKRDITPDPDDYDSWTDVNNNNKFDPGVDTYEDRNGNGRFDGIWIAGFGTNRPAKGINDPQWVRALALRNNGVTVVMVTIDAIGIFHNEFINVRKALKPALGIDHVMFSSTHSHEVIDTMKIWSFWKRIKGLDIPGFGFDPSHNEFIQDMMTDAVEEAVRKLKPADMYCVQVELPREGFVSDSRKPDVLDPNMYLWRFTEPGKDYTIATFVSWGNHPESLGGSNPIVSSDFPHYLREGLENGVPEPNGVEGFGGMCLYFQGQIGGLMNPLHVTVPHRDGKTMLKDKGFEKTEALGYNVAIAAAKALRSDQVWKNEEPFIAVAARTALAPMQGHYKWAMMLGLLHEGYYWGSRAKTEINAVRIGDVVVLTTPGEIYPEIVEGGVRTLPGRDFDVPAIETPPLREVMEKHARMALVIGLANDEIGYIIPKSQWDVEPPYIYDDDDQYGEGNSGGPEIGPVVHAESMILLERINSTFEKAPSMAARN